MPFNGSGTFSRYTPGTPYVVNTTIDETVVNAEMADLASGLTTAICKDGQTTCTASIPFDQGITVGGGFGSTGVTISSAGVISADGGVTVATGQNALSVHLVGSFTSAVTGAASGTATIYYTRIGKLVTLVISPVSAGASSATNISYAVTNMPATLIPVIQVRAPVPVYDNGTAQTNPGVLVIQTGGNPLLVYKDLSGASFTSSAGTTGMDVGVSISYVVS